MSQAPYAALTECTCVIRGSLFAMMVLCIDGLDIIDLVDCYRSSEIIHCTKIFVADLNRQK